MAKAMVRGHWNGDSRYAAFFSEKERKAKSAFLFEAEVRDGVKPELIEKMVKAGALRIEVVPEDAGKKK